MAFPLHALFSFGGDMLGGQEQWTNNIRFGTFNSTFTDGVVEEPAILDWLMSKLAPRFTATHTTTGLGYTNTCRLLWGKFNQIGPDGRYRLPNDSVRKDMVPPVTASSGANYYAPQLALAVSFLTAAERGPGSKGRIFIPVPSVAPNSQGMIPSSDCIKIAANWAALLTEFNAYPGESNGAQLFPAIVSEVSGTARAIRSVRVGDRVDTMRSRRNALVETYSANTSITGIDS